LAEVNRNKKYTYINLAVIFHDNGHQLSEQHIMTWHDTCQFGEWRDKWHWWYVIVWQVQPRHRSALPCTATNL